MAKKDRQDNKQKRDKNNRNKNVDFANDICPDDNTKNRNDKNKCCE